MPGTNSKGFTTTGRCSDCSRTYSSIAAWSAAVLSGDASFRGRLEGIRADIENDINAISEVDQRLGAALQTSQKWSALTESARALLSGGFGESSAETFAQHTKVIEDTISLIAHVGDTSKLTLDPDLDSFYLMNIIIFQAPELSEALAQARGLGISVAAAGKATPEQLARLNELAVLTEYLRKRVDDSFSKALRSRQRQSAGLDAESIAIVGGVREANEHVATSDRQSRRRNRQRRVFLHPDQERRDDLLHGGARDWIARRAPDRANRAVPA